MKLTKKKVVVPALAAVIALGFGVAAIHESHAQGKDPAHGHEGHGGGAAKLTLDHGKKWQTDATLREGMTRIRDQVQASLPAVHAETYTKEQYAALAAGIEKEIATIMANCKLPTDADAQLHLILVEFWAGTDTMKKDGNRMSGVVKAIGALKSYGEFFDHPGWVGVKH